MLITILIVLAIIALLLFIFAAAAWWASCVTAGGLHSGDRLAGVGWRAGDALPCACAASRRLQRPQSPESGAT